MVEKLFEQIKEESKTKEGAENYMAFIMLSTDILFACVNKHLGEEALANLMFEMMAFIVERIDCLEKLPIGDGVCINRDAAMHMVKKEVLDKLKKEFGDEK